MCKLLIRSGVLSIAGVAALSALLSSSVSATVIYTEDFSGAAGTIMSGKTPTSESGLLGGSASATWTATAAVTTNPDALFTLNGSGVARAGTAGTGADVNLIENNYLPFVPVANTIYDMHLEMESDGAGASGNWLGLAYGQAGFNSHTPGGGSSALSNDNPFGLLISKGSGQVQSFGGLGTANTVINTAVGAYAADQFHQFDTILDTSGASWTMKWLIDGSQVGTTFTYSTNPSIGLVAFGTNKLTGSVQNFSLTGTSVPEPASLGLLSALGGGLMIRRRKH